MAVRGVRHYIWVVQQVGTLEKCREDSQNDLPPLPGRVGPVGGSIRTLDDRGGTSTPGKIEDENTVSRLW